MKSLTLLLLPIFLWSCNSENKNFLTTTDGVKMYYESYGSGVNTLIFIHGWSCNSQVWVDQIDYFKKDYKVIVTDLPGFGKSGNERKDWTMQQYGDDVASLANNLNASNIYLIGHSMGGLVVLETARKLGKKVKAVVLVDVLKQISYPYDSISATDFTIKYASNFKKFDYMLEYYKGDSSLTKRYLSTMPAGEQMPENWKESWKHLSLWMEKDSKTCIAEITVPIRAINSDEIETNIGEWRKYARDFDVTVFENSGHFLSWQYPKKFNESLEKIIKPVKD